MAVGDHLVDRGLGQIVPDRGDLGAESGKRRLVGAGGDVVLRRYRMPAHEIGRCAAERGEGGGELEGDDVLEADAPGATSQVQRTRTAIGEQREFRRMDALARDDAAQRVVGVGLQHVDHAFGGLLDTDAEHVGALFLESLAGLLDLQHDLATEEVIRVQPAENGVAIGDGRFGTAPGKADRAGIGAGAFRSETDFLGQRIDLEDHAGARTNGVEMERRHVELETVHQRLVLDPRLAARNDAHVEGSAAHVRADQRVVADQLADIGSTENAADRA